MNSLAGVETIELRVERLSNLFDPLDPFPPSRRDLSKSAEDFIVGWARELPAAAPLRIIVHLSDPDAAASQASAVKEALSRHFAYRAGAVRGDLHELFRIGRIYLGVGLGVLAACILAGRLIEAALDEGPAERIFVEGLMILGWVANWRPLEIFLYDWWPLTRRRALFLRLAKAELDVRFGPLAES